MKNVLPQRTVGMDLGDRYSYLHILDELGECVEEGRLRTTPKAITHRFGAAPAARIVIGAGTHSPWVSRLLDSLGHEVFVANPRRLRAIYDNDAKSDRVDAEYLARIGRLDPRLLRGIQQGKKPLGERPPPGDRRRSRTGLLSNSPHSTLRAIMGSVREARRAGR